MPRAEPTPPASADFAAGYEWSISLFALSPTHTGAFQPLGHERHTRRFHHAGADWKPTGLPVGIGHPIALFFAVCQLATQTFATRCVSRATQLARQPTPCRDDVVRPAELITHDDAQTGVFGPALDTVVTVIRAHRGSQMVAGVPMIDNPGCPRVEGTVEGAPVFLLIEAERPEALVNAVSDYVERREAFIMGRQSGISNP
jgi:hypothetical protein